MRRSLLIFSSLLSLFCLITIIVLSNAQALDGESLLKETQAALDAQDYTRALSLAEKAIFAMPSYSEAYRLRGNARRNLKDLQKALVDYNRALQLDGQNHLAYGGRAVVRSQLKDLDAALQDVNQALRLKTDYAKGYGIRAVILIAQKQYGPAINDLNESLRLNPKNAGGLLSRGNAKYESGDYRGAIEDYNATEKLNPRQAGLYYNRGLARKKLKDNDQSEQDFTRSIELGYRVAEAYAKRGEAALERGDQVKAQQDLAKARELDPKLKIAPSVLPARDKAGLSSAPKPAVAPEQPSATAAVPPSRTSEKPTSFWAQPPPEPAPRQEKTQIPGVQAQMDDPCGQIPLPKGEEAAGPSNPSTSGADLGLLQTPLAQNVSKLTKSRYAAVVTAGRGAMEMLLGPLLPAKEKEFQAAWALMADYPSQKVVAYLDRLNPLLVEFLALTQSTESVLSALEEAKYEAEMAAAYESEKAAREAMKEVGDLTAQLKTLKVRMEQVSAQVSALGEPPNPLEDKCRARRRANKAFNIFNTGGGAWKFTGRRNVITRIFEDYRITKNEIVFGESSARSFILVPGKYIGSKEPDGVISWNFSWTAPPKLIADQDTIRLTVHVKDAGVVYSDSNCSIAMYLRTAHHLNDRVIYNGMQRKWQEGYKLGEKYIFQIGDKRGVAWKAENYDKEEKYTTVVTNLKKSVGGWKRLTPQDDAKDFREKPIVGWTPEGEGETFFWPKLLKAQPGWTMTLEVILKSEWISGAVYYDYIFDPSLTAPPPMPAPVMAHKPDETPKKPDKPSKDEQETAILKEKVDFHKSNIKLLESDLKIYQQMLGKAKDEAGQKALQGIITGKLADLQAEKDAITTLQTGEFTRTRTAWDEMVASQMAANSREMAGKINEANHRRQTVDRVINLLPEHERETTRKWAQNQLGPGEQDPEKIKKVAKIIAEKAQGHNLADAGKYDELAADQQLAVDVLENYQAAANMSMYATPFVSGGATLALVYGLTSGGITGYQTGGLLGEKGAGWGGAAVGAVTTAARFWSPKIDYAITFYEGYTAPSVDGQQAGVAGGLKNVAITFIYRKATGAVTKGIVRYQAKVANAARQAKLDVWRDAQRKVDFKQQQEYGKAMVEIHQKLYDEFKTLKKSGAPADQLKIAEQKLMDQTAAIKHAPHAKGYLKFSATPEQQKAYNSTSRLHTNRVVAELKTELGKQGFDTKQLSFRPIRNAGNTSPGMDLDLAMYSSRGNKITYTDPKTGKTSAIDIYTGNAMVQKVFDKVYAEQSGGRTAHASWQMVTSGKHLEAYSDPNWLRIKQYQKNGLDPLAMVDPRYAADAAKVTEVKAHELRNQGGLGKENQNWEIFRGTAKDIESKVIPNIQARINKTKDPVTLKKLNENLKFYENLQKAMGMANHDPVAAQQQIKSLTGYDAVDVVHMTSAAIESMGKWK